MEIRILGLTLKTPNVVPQGLEKLKCPCFSLHCIIIGIYFHRGLHALLLLKAKWLNHTDLFWMKRCKKGMGEIDIKFTRFWVISTIQDHPGSGKLKKGQKIFEGHNKGQTTKFLNFYNFLALLGSLWGKNSGALIFLVSEAIKAKKAMQRPNHKKLQRGKSNEPKIGFHDIKSYLYVLLT